MHPDIELQAVILCGKYNLESVMRVLKWVILFPRNVYICVSQQEVYPDKLDTLRNVTSATYRAFKYNIQEI
jgi:hypothetical protein